MMHALDRYFEAWNAHDPAADRLRSVVGYFDTATMLGQLGLQAHSTAMKLAQGGGLGDDARGVTSMWTPHFLNGVFQAAGGSTDLTMLGGQWL